MIEIFNQVKGETLENFNKIKKSQDNFIFKFQIFPKIDLTIMAST